MSLIFFFISLSAFSQDCKYPFPLKEDGKIFEACIDYKKSYQIGHIKFFSFPRAKKDDDIWPFEHIYFTSTKHTRDELCKLFGEKKESPRSHILEVDENGIEYSQKGGFQLKGKQRIIKVLACRSI